jgi:phosphopantothenoylcysteine synthetase/decarboxylase
MSAKPLGRLLLGVCGSSAATAADQLVYAASGHADQVTVIATPTAARLFLPPLDVRVFTDADWADEPLHVDLATASDVLLIAPATATTIAKAAAGIADTLLSAVILTHGPGVYFAPCMNAAMWTSPALVRAVAALRSDGHHVLEPDPVASLTSEVVGSGVGEIPGDVLATVTIHHQTHANADAIAGHQTQP